MTIEQIQIMLADLFNLLDELCQLLYDLHGVICEI